MPFYRDFITPETSVLFWKYEENDDLPESLIGEADSEKILNYHPKKLLEYLMIRKLLRQIKPNHQIKYKKAGQPFLFPADSYISVSHSFPFGVLAVSSKRVGIDMEKIVPKIVRVKHKFLNERELEWTNTQDETELLTVIWAVKEALYKLHPCKYWSLKKYYEVEPFDLDDLSGLKCRVFDDSFEDCYEANVIQIENYYFALIEENHDINYRILAETAD